MVPALGLTSGLQVVHPVSGRTVTVRRRDVVKDQGLRVNVHFDSGTPVLGASPHATFCMAAA